jgi:hypothetical protein
MTGVIAKEISLQLLPLLGVHDKLAVEPGGRDLEAEPVDAAERDQL